MENILSWKNLLMVLIPKTARPRFWKDFRGIFLIACLAKLYMLCLVLLGQRMLIWNLALLAEARFVLVFAYTAHLNSSMLTESIRLMHTCEPGHTSEPEHTLHAHLRARAHF